MVKLIGAYFIEVGKNKRYLTIEQIKKYKNLSKKYITKKLMYGGGKYTEEELKSFFTSEKMSDY